MGTGFECLIGNHRKTQSKCVNFFVDSKISLLYEIFQILNVQKLFSIQKNKSRENHQTLKLKN